MENKEQEKISIPENILQICRDMAKVAQEAGLHDFQGEFYPGFNQTWQGKIKFAWKDGRHGAESNQLTVWSEFNVITKVNLPNNEKKIH